MKKDLSQVDNSVTSLFIELLPQIEEIKKDTTLFVEAKLIKAQQLIITELVKARNDSHRISAERLNKDRIAVLRTSNIDEIIYYMKKVIKNGQNYDTAKKIEGA